MVTQIWLQINSRILRSMNSDSLSYIPFGTKKIWFCGNAQNIKQLFTKAKTTPVPPDQKYLLGIFSLSSCLISELKFVSFLPNGLILLSSPSKVEILLQLKLLISLKDLGQHCVEDFEVGWGKIQSITILKAFF